MATKITLRSALLASLAASSLVLAGCSTAEEENTTASSGTTVEVEDNHGVVEVPQDPKAVASTDNRSFEILRDWGVDLVAAPLPLVPRSVPEYRDNKDIKDMGTHREPNLEELVAAQPDLIINGQRFESHYEDIKKLNPDAAVVDFTPREDKPLDEELRRQTEALGEIFGKDAEADALIADFDKALERAKKAYDGDSKVMAVNVSGGNIGYVAPSKGRFWGPIFDWLNLKPALEVPESSNSHTGDDISVEAIADSNPAWMLVLDRDAATSDADKPEYEAAKNIIDKNDALKNVPAIKDKHTVFAPEDSYVNENIITYTEILNSIADSFEAGKK
ncbi:siderophore ABC transporter substrate-binding protein [Corynebacterium suicordis]|uniref:ABC transporter substrate-binding protein n=1 Tax=Corynebacterium suicordis DSM 45110 TaxID=1121369 RepID=A0ABR9ZJI3_9CORY|nr:ABC transporter substrate-binding protein [Corynebacterium suicordis]MBF4552807.1 ABC transporter substrate-binding protein [Corynebacterium suicordis DSM 45110]MDR6278234.1 iron complex transport system substrate-binding protein [Corynebacterium suicordis]